MNKIIANKSTAKKIDIKKLAILAMFVALGYISLYVFRIKVQFLSLEIKDIFIVTSGFVFGPLAAIGVSFVEALLEMITVSDTGLYGAVMNFAGAASFAGTASLIYKYKKNIYGAVLGLVTGIFALTAVMIGLNLLITPLYLGASRSDVINIIPTLLLPFNLIRGCLNAGLTFIVYKPLSNALKAIGMLPKSSTEFKVDKKTLVFTIVAIVLIVVAVLALVISMHGNVELFSKV